MSEPSTTPHLLIFPYPAQGHMLPLLDLTHNLSLLNLSITILTTPKNLPILTPLLSTHPHIQTLILPFPSHPSIPIGAENIKDIGNHGNSSLISALSQLTDPVIHWFKYHPSPPNAILSDFFLGWTHHLACQLGIPRFAFYSSGAFLASVLNSLLPNLRSLQGLNLDNVALPNLPNSPSFPFSHLPSIVRRYNETDPDYRMVVDGLIANMASYGSIFNTYDALEGVYLDHVRKELGHVRVWSVGPVSLLGAATVERGGVSSDSGCDVFTWLDRCPDGSVVYVCFGSQMVLTERQMEALTSGLEKSETRFILAVKSAMSEQKDNEHGVVPAGFEERIAGRGLVIRGWAPQVLILSHQAVGGLLTHCGWNSVLEGIVAGVVLLAWPMEADQFVNAKLLVEDVGVGIVVCEGMDEVPDSGKLARTIAESMNGVGGQKVKAMELREKALGAVNEGGSSTKGLNGFAEELSKLQFKRNGTAKKM